MRKLFTIGETVYDIIFKNNIPIEAKPGGAMLNTAVSLGRLGMKVEFVGDGADDPIAEFIEQFLKTNGISTQYLTRYESSKSRLAMAFLDDENNASYSFHKIQKKGLQEIRYPTVSKNDVVLFGSFFGIKKALRKDLMTFLNYARKQEAIIVYDPNFRAQHKYLVPEVYDMIIENIQISHIVKGSNEDFENIFGLKTAEETYQKINSIHKDIPFIYTANKHGVDVFSSGRNYHFDAMDIIPVSTIGAGDTFNAGIMYGIVNQSITQDMIYNLPFSVWEEMIPKAVEFSSKVCLSYDNYLTENYTQSIVSKKAK